MARMHFNPIVEHEQRAEQGVVELFGQATCLVSAEEIGSADGTHKQRVAGEHARGLVTVAHEQRNVLGCVTRRV